MTSQQEEWAERRDELKKTLISLGLPGELGDALAKMLKSPKAIQRMTAYLNYEKPKKAEVVVDEALAIMTEIDLWRQKKQMEEANARYNEMFYYGFGDDEDE